MAFTMAFTWEERDLLVVDTAELVLQWLALLDDKGKANVISDILVHGYTSPDLKRLNEHAAARITTLKHDTATGVA